MKKKMLKRIVAFSLALAFVLSLSACGGGGSNETNNQSSTTQANNNSGGAAAKEEDTSSSSSEVVTLTGYSMYGDNQSKIDKATWFTALSSVRFSFILPLICFIVIVYFGYWVRKND